MTRVRPELVRIINELRAGGPRDQKAQRQCGKIVGMDEIRMKSNSLHHHENDGMNVPKETKQWISRRKRCDGTKSLDLDGSDIFRFRQPRTMQGKDGTPSSQFESRGCRSQYPSVIREGVQNHVQDVHRQAHLRDLK